MQSPTFTACAAGAAGAAGATLAGATLAGVFDGHDGWHIPILDPEGNEFCIQ